MWYGVCSTESNPKSVQILNRFITAQSDVYLYYYFYFVLLYYILCVSVCFVIFIYIYRSVQNIPIDINIYVYPFLSSHTVRFLVGLHLDAGLPRTKKIKLKLSIWCCDCRKRRFLSQTILLLASLRHQLKFPNIDTSVWRYRNVMNWRKHDACILCVNK